MDRERREGERDVEKRGRCSVGRGTDGRCVGADMIGANWLIDK